MTSYRSNLVAVCIAFLFAVFVLPCRGGEAATNSAVAEIEGLVRDLGDKSFEVRRRAELELRKIGYPAVPALEKAAGSEDPEVASSAKSILEDARMGITSRWPPELVEKLRQFSKLQEKQRCEIMRAIIAELKDDSVPFILVRIGAGSKAEAGAVYEALKEFGDLKTAEELVKSIHEPADENRARILAWAFLRLGKPGDAMKVLAVCAADDPLRRDIVENTVKVLIAGLAARKYEEVEETAAYFAGTAPSEARFLYLQALAQSKLDRENEAGKLCEKAIKLNPDKEDAHYTAGDMLTDLRCDDLAIPEWEAILRIPPTDDVYDINAHLRLGQIFARRRRYEDAATHYETSLKAYRNARGGGRGGFGIVGADENELEATVRALRAKAESARKVHFTFSPIVKDNKRKELKEALTSAAATLSARILPLGVRLLDLEQCAVTYDSGKKEMAFLLNGTPSTTPLKLDMKGRKANIAIITLDCIYIYEVDPSSEQVRKLSRFEMDYRVKLELGKALRDYRGPGIKVGDKEYSVEELLKGVVLDYLPEAFEIRLEGTPLSGKPETLELKVPVEDAELGTTVDESNQ